MAYIDTDPSDPSPVPGEDAGEGFVSGETLESLARAAGNGVVSPEDYGRERDMQHVPVSVGTLVRNNPVAALFIAAAVGFLIGRTLARD
jgi:ElaB/YqjD/DUF883 family membrane-anchored ribosome-binding protein